MIRMLETRVGVWAGPCLVLGLAALAAAPALGQSPAEVQQVAWCPGASDCLQWSAVDGAVDYRVYRGRDDDLAALADGTVDSCEAGTFADTTTGPALVDAPARGAVHWFLVAARGPGGEGSAGAGSDGPRFVDAAGSCTSGAGLVINELDYDQPGTDSGEFVEIHNPLAAPVPLADRVLVLVNGLTGLEYARVALDGAGESLPAGGYLVIGSPDVVQALPPGTPALTLPSSSNNIQNGSPDALALFDLATETVIDALSYEGEVSGAQLDGVAGFFDLVEGNSLIAQDSNVTPGTLARIPDGVDSDDADADWSFTETSSPGQPNPAP